ncbi:MAG: flagellar biosynthesis anti-sigma factor FlgM [Nitrospirales bacterium]|nr:flagellar biosynthesis anti-sigma factor FlgM [Nitrospira sp.]MDR4502579.1 flagellar biosynthesis anti-sigma factor FlgM [Nitrospirales bacterium]
MTIPIPPPGSRQLTPPEDASKAIPSSPEKSAVPSESSARQTHPRDAVFFSENQEEHETVQTMIRQLPEIRQHRVQALREAIASGKYRVSSMDVANAMVRDLIPNESEESR